MKPLFTLALAGAFSLITSLAAAGTISADSAWARASIGKARAGIAYVTLTNTGTQDDRLVGAAAEVSDKVELHTHIRDGDVMRMRQVDGIDLPAGKTVMLEPGGLHVMLIGLRGPLKLGESFPLTLNFEKAGKLTTTVSIQKSAAHRMMNHNKHHNMPAKKK